MSAQGSYEDNIEGIPLVGDLTQLESSAAPIRDDDALRSNSEGWDRKHNSSIDLSTSESVGEVAEVDEPSVETKDANRWSDGLEDEENDFGYVSFSEADEDSEQGLVPEPQSLSRDAQSAGRDVETPPGDVFPEVDLEPDNIQYGSE